MTVFSSLKEAENAGFSYYEYDRELKMHVVIRVRVDDRGRKLRELALAC